MKARHIVVAIGTERLVVGIALMDGTAHGIDAVDAPRQTLAKGLLTAHDREVGHGIGFVVVGIVVHAVEEDAPR